MGNLKLEFEQTTEETLAAESAAGAQQGDIVSIPQGWSTWRVLPAIPVGLLAKLNLSPTCPHGTVWVAVDEHYLESPTDSKKKYNHVCPKKHGKGYCPSCAHQSALWKSGYPSDQETAKRWRAKTRYYARVLQRPVSKDSTIDPLAVRVLPISWTMKEKDLAVKLEELKVEHETVDYTNPIDGFDLKIHRAGELIATSYQFSFASRKSPLIPGDQNSSSWVEKAQSILNTVPDCWPTLMKPPTAEAILDGIASGLGQQLASAPRQALPVGRPTIQSKVYQVPPEAEFIPDAEVEEASPDSDAQPYAG